MSNTVENRTVSGVCVELQPDGTFAWTHREWAHSGLAPQDVIVEPRYVGICGSDLAAANISESGVPEFAGPLKLPVVLGHEVSGIVLEIGREVNRVDVGDIVALESVIPCGVCDVCLLGNRNHCPDAQLVGLTRPGGFSDHLSIPATACHRIAQLEAVFSRDEALRVGALFEPLACAYNALFRTGTLRPGETIGVWGLGSIGLCVVALARASGAGLIVGFEPIEERRRRALAAGADLAFAPPFTQADCDDIRAFNVPTGLKIQVEASGNPSGNVPFATQFSSTVGTIVIVSRERGSFGVETNAIVTGGLEIRASRGQAPGAFAHLIELCRRRRLDCRNLLSDIVSIRSAIAILQGTTICHPKVLVDVRTLVSAS